MTLDAEVGAGIELGGASLKALFGVAATLDGIHQTLKQIRDREESYEFGAVQVRLMGNGTTTSGTIEIDLGGPSYGRLWQIRNLVVGGVLWTTTVAGSALVAVGSTRDPTPPLTNIVDEAGSLPSVAQYSTGQILIRHPSRLRVIIINATSSTQYVAGGHATDLPDKRERIETGL